MNDSVYLWKGYNIRFFAVAMLMESRQKSMMYAFVTIR